MARDRIGSANGFFVVVRVGTPGGTLFEAVPSTSGASAELRLDSVAGTTVLGSLDATLPDVGGGPALVVSAEF